MNERRTATSSHSSVLGAGPISSGGRHRRRRRGARAFAVVLIVLGALTVTDALITLVWQEPLSALYADLRQSNLSGELRSVERAVPGPATARALANISDERQRIALLARELEHHASNGSPIGRIVIPKIGANFVVVDGTDTEDLMSGPGIMTETTFPGVPGTTAIAGHRTTYLAPFRHIDSLNPGDQIILLMPYAHLYYTVVGHRVVQPTDVSAAISRANYTRLVLSACTPLFSAEKRLLVYSKLTRMVPVGAARELPAGQVPQPVEPEAPASSERFPRI